MVTEKESSHMELTLRWYVEAIDKRYKMEDCEEIESIEFEIPKSKSKINEEYGYMPIIYANGIGELTLSIDEINWLSDVSIDIKKELQELK